MQPLCTLCMIIKKYAETMQKLCRNDSETVQKLCSNYAETMRNYARIMKKYANIVSIGHGAEVMHIYNADYAKNHRILQILEKIIKFGNYFANFV